MTDYSTWPNGMRCIVRPCQGSAYTGEFKITEIHTPTQVGTHIDAPSHYANDGGSIDTVPLTAFFGLASVLDLSTLETDMIMVDQCARDWEWPKIIIIKTRASSQWHNCIFPEDYPVLSIEALEYLISKGMSSLAVDAPSVDKFDCKIPHAHSLLYQNGIHIMECANLYAVKEGHYEMVAFPLKIKGADGSPVRAVLRIIEGK